MRALIAARFSRSYAFTVVRESSLPVDALVSPVVTLMSLDAGVLVVTLSFHNKFADQVACSASAGNVRRLSLVVSLRSSFTAWRSVPCLAWWQHSSPPSILSDTLSLPDSSEAASLTGEFTVDVNSTSCGALDAAVTVALVCHCLAAPTAGRCLCFDDARPQSLPQRVPVTYIGGAASWRPCNVAYPHQGPVPHS